MYACRLAVGASFAVVALGCGGGGPPAAPSVSVSPVVEAWREAGLEGKYDLDTLTDLRDSDPAYRDDTAWAEIVKNVIGPQRVADGLPDLGVDDPAYGMTYESESSSRSD